MTIWSFGGGMPWGGAAMGLPAMPGMAMAGGGCARRRRAALEALAGGGGGCPRRRGQPPGLATEGGLPAGLMPEGPRPGGCGGRVVVVVGGCRRRGGAPGAGAPLPVPPPPAIGGGAGTPTTVPLPPAPPPIAPPAPAEQPGGAAAGTDEERRRALADALKADGEVMRAMRDWGGLGPEARVQALERVSAIQGRIYGFTPAPVRHDPGMDAQPGLMGGFTPHDYRIALSSAALADPLQAIDTITHEQAHAFQHSTVQRLRRGELGPDDPYFDLAQAWQDNYDNYLDPGRHGYGAYRNQPLEAHSFATGSAIRAAVQGALAPQQGAWDMRELMAMIARYIEVAQAQAA